MLKVHFLNVGHGDCTLISHPSGRLTMVDVNNGQEYDDESLKEYASANQRTSGLAGICAPQPVAGILGGQSMYGLGNVLQEAALKLSAKNEITDPVAFLRENYPRQGLFRFILSHPDLDHMRGLKRLHDEIGIFNFWDTRNKKPSPGYRSDADRVDWEFYQSLRTGSGGLTPRYYTQGDRLFAFAIDENGSGSGDGIQILGPTAALVDLCNSTEVSNDLSYVLRIFHAGRSILLPGDVETTGWTFLQKAFGNSLKSDFLKASHHGRDTGYHLETLQSIAPLMVFTSVGRKPSTDASHKYCKECGRVASTRYYGNITLQIDDAGAWQWFVQRNAER